MEPGADSGPKEMEHPGEELVFLLEGTLVFRVGGDELALRPGDAAGFKAGDQDGHCLQNRTCEDARILAVGSRSDEDYGEYSDIDMKFHAGRYTGGGGHTRKNGDPI